MIFERNHVPTLQCFELETDRGTGIDSFLKQAQSAQKHKLIQPRNIFRIAGQGVTLPPDYYKAVDDAIKRGDDKMLQTWFDFTQMLKEIPLVYKTIYQTVSDPSLPEQILVKDFAPNTNFFFTQLLDGESILLNEVQYKGLESVLLGINAGGYMRSFREIIFDNPLKQASMMEAAARGYRNYLNAVYMNPIVSFVGEQNKTLVNVATIKDKADMTWWEKNWHIMKTGMQYFKEWKISNQFPEADFVLVMNEVTESWFQDATDAVNPDGNKRYPQLTEYLRRRVIYNGAKMKDKDRPVTFSGIPTGTVMIVPIGIKKFVEFEKIPFTSVVSKTGQVTLGELHAMYDCRGMFADTDGIIRIDMIPLADTANADSPMKK